mgnify:CR=1 FL=1
MKSIYAKDIKAMLLTEEEFFSIEQEISEINEIGFSESLNFTLQNGTDWQIKKDGITKMLKYLVCKIIKNNRTNIFSEVCRSVAQLLGTSRYNVARWIKGMRGSFIIADQFGQDYIEII